MTPASSPSHIILIMHGFTCKEKNYMALRHTIAEKYPNAAIHLPTLPLTTFSRVDPNDVVETCLQLLDNEWAEVKRSGTTEMPKIILIGHSSGAVLLRKLYVCALGETKYAPLERNYSQKTPRLWSPYIDRIILFAGMNRGWSINDHLYGSLALQVRFGVWLARLVPVLQRLFIFQLRRGAPFITQLRIQWLYMLRQARENRQATTTVIQLLGTIDELVGPEDDIDLVTCQNFIYLDIPHSGHMNVLFLNDRNYGERRKTIFLRALSGSVEELLKWQVVPSDDIISTVDEGVTDVVFVIHGIRDTGYWTQKLARRIKWMGDSSTRKFAIETSTYGYFPMLPFLFFSGRRTKVAWLMDQYTENLSRYPNASFSFIGHSNGTYLLAKALREYPACRFKHVLFAGSVVSSRYDWTTLMREQRVQKIFNVVASADWVVACFPKSFERLQLQDLGSAGFDGFRALDESCQLKFIPGSHGAAIEEKYWDDIAGFIVNGTFSDQGPSLVDQTPRGTLMNVLGILAPLPFVLLVSVLLLGAIAIMILVEPGEVKIAALVVYVLVIWWLTMKF